MYFHARADLQAQQSQSAAALERQKKKERAMSRKAVHSKSFAQNMFRGILEPEQVFPYPKVSFLESYGSIGLLLQAFFLSSNLSKV